MSQINAILSQLKPFMMLMALACGLIGAWALACDLIPVLRQVWAPRAGAQAILIGGACLAVIARGGT